MLATGSSSSNPSIEPDRITIGLYSREIGLLAFSEQLFGEKENIRTMVEKFTQAARAQGRDPPEIVISVLLVPDWEKAGNSYTHQEYQATKQRLFKELKKAFQDLPIEDFYEAAHLTDNEKRYLHHLQGLGSNADIIKTRAILNNKNCRHLQIDSNTIIRDYAEFYRKTFAGQIQRVALNASYYDVDYVSAHNKVVYTTPDCSITPALEKEYLAYIQQHQHDKADKIPEKNSIYSRVFAPALSSPSVQLTVDNFDILTGKHFYPACMDKAEYSITADIVTAINSSWAADQSNDDALSALKKMPSLLEGDVKYDFQSFVYILKKYARYLTRNATNREDPTVFYEQFLKISDCNIDLQIISRYYQYVLKDHPEHLKALTVFFPITPKGNVLTTALFGCSVKALQANPNIMPRDIGSEGRKQLLQSLIRTDKETILNLPKTTPVMLAHAMYKTIADRHPGIKDGPHAEASLDFLRAIAGGTLENLNAQVEKLNTFPADVKQILIRETTNILSRAADNHAHFNYVPYRKEKLEKLTALLPAQEVQSKSLLFSFGRPSVPFIKSEPSSPPTTDGDGPKRRNSIP